MRRNSLHKFMLSRFKYVASWSNAVNVYHVSTYLAQTKQHESMFGGQDDARHRDCVKLKTSCRGDGHVGAHLLSCGLGTILPNAGV
jgi:hypothetical protein